MPYSENILLIKSGGLGTILRTTPVARALREKYPNAKIQWLTRPDATAMVRRVDAIDQVNALVPDGIEVLRAQHFDLLVNLDSHDDMSLALAANLPAKNRYGFVLNRWGSLEPASAHAYELLKLQTDDHFRCRDNGKSFQQIYIEAAGLQWDEQSYDVKLDCEETYWAQAYCRDHALEAGRLLGVNLGVSQRMAAKQWPPDQIAEFIKLFLNKYPAWQVILMHGPEDQAALSEVLDQLGDPVSCKNPNRLHIPGKIFSLPQFMALLGQIPILVTACTFAAHAGIAVGSHVFVLSGPQPPQEYYFYGRGKAIHGEMDCIPCLAYLPEACSNEVKLACMQHFQAAWVMDALCAEGVFG